MSTISSQTSEKSTFDPRRTLEIVLTKLHPVNNDSKAYATMLRCLYRLNPEMFQIIGEIHNSIDGTETYMSVRMYTDKDKYSNMHIYGIRRGHTFTVTKMHFFYFGQTINFDYTKPTYKNVCEITKKTNGW